MTEAQIIGSQIANIFGPFMAFSASIIFVERGTRKAFDAQNNALKKQKKAIEAHEKSKKELKELTRRMEEIFIQVSEHTHFLADHTLKEMASMTRENNKHAQQANNLMKESDQKVVQAGDAMNNLTLSMKEMSEASRESSKIIKTINDIAFQTNILSLNANVEAVRACEAGAGFSVVAQEVRNLAKRNAEAAENTEGLIMGIIDKIENGTEIVSGTHHMFSEVASNVTRSSAIMEEIEAASVLQDKGINRITIQLS
ncbi:MAG: hypothetical protein GY749_23360 [Desulfobacteraceae bacterium]|nr:hypothetical protein [Desulfobacteraceae bacterium]